MLETARRPAKTRFSHPQSRLVRPRVLTRRDRDVTMSKESRLRAMSLEMNCTDLLHAREPLPMRSLLALFLRVDDSVAACTWPFSAVADEGPKPLTATSATPKVAKAEDNKVFDAPASSHRRPVRSFPRRARTSTPG